MAKNLVIVESPAKARTIGSYLGPDYEVLASIGHIRDLVPNGRSLPEEHRKKWWADYAVDVDNGFEPFYEVPDEKAAQVAKLRAALKGKETLVLATDEDREGEAISWHLLEILKPAKKVKVQRIAFHEITRDAILRALQNPRDVDRSLVEAQETRRILDRLYGYTLSPVLWTRVTRGLSAGRVQSPAVKLVVDREQERRVFKTSVYWDLRAWLEKSDVRFPADLRQVGGRKVALGDDFDPLTGGLTEKSKDVVWLDADAAGRLAVLARAAKPYRVDRIAENEVQEKPAAPFMTTTLQQEANRKLGWPADRTMRIAQQLYEGIDLGGEQTGLITYMRTDSLTLAKDAVEAIRGYVRENYPDCLPAKPNVYNNKVKNAQEAHEAIRPTAIERRPDAISGRLSADQLKLYTLIWQRTVACQMLPARVLRTEVKVGVDVPLDALREIVPTADSPRLLFAASGRQVVFDGYMRVYQEGRDDEGDPTNRLLPRMREGDEVALASLDPAEHATKPPPRYTEATLVKRLESLGIGRPSTYASILSVIVDRGYVRREGKQLVPTWLAFLTMQVLEGSFEELVNLEFTARMDESLDEISEGKTDSRAYLRDFFLGQGERPGLKPMVDTRKKEIPFPAYPVGVHPETGETILLRNSKEGGAFLQIGDAEGKRYANVPEDVAPADLTVEKALELFAARSGPSESVGVHPATGRKLLVKNRGGFYLEAERTPEEVERKDKPTWISVPPGVDPRELSKEELDFLCELPRLVGANPENGSPIEFKIGKFGAYLECGAERRTVEDWREGMTMDGPRAAAILAQPKGRPVRAAAAPLKELGEVPNAAGPVRVMSGRFGPYVTDGATNATLPRGKDPVSLTVEEAQELLDKRREAGPPVKKTATRGRAKPAAVKKKAPVRKKKA